MFFIVQIQGWNYKAAMCQFNLVPVPSMAMLKNEEGEQLHPFRRPVFLPISLTEYQQQQFTSESITCMYTHDFGGGQSIEPV